MLQRDWQTDLCSLPVSVTAASWGRVTMETELHVCVCVGVCVCERMELPSQSISSVCGGVSVCERVGEVYNVVRKT